MTDRHDSFPHGVLKRTVRELLKLAGRQAGAPSLTVAVLFSMVLASIIAGLLVVGLLVAWLASSRSTSPSRATPSPKSERRRGHGYHFGGQPFSSTREV